MHLICSCLFVTACISEGNVLTGIDAPTSDASPPKAWVAEPSGTTKDLFAVWGAGPNEVFAVGGTPGTTGPGDPGVIVRWDGTAATAADHLVNLLGVFDRTAVGEYGGEGSATTRTGTAWSARDVIAPGLLRGTWQSSPGSYVVGDGGRLFYSSESVPSNWVAQTTATTGPLYGVWGSSSTDVYAVGAGGVILHNTNAGVGGTGTWTKTVVGTSTLRAVWGSSANDVYVVGEAPAVILHSTDGGLTWTTAQLPSSAIGLASVSGTGANNVYAVGATGGLVFHSVGNDVWTTQQLPTTRDLFGIWLDANGDAFAVGRSGTFVRKPH